MHVSDALISPAVAGVTTVVAASMMALSIVKLRRDTRADIVETYAYMAVFGAFIFVVQMFNFAIPATGSSGHIVGGILLAAFLGPWAAFLTLTAVILLQALLLGDGGIMAMGCNVINLCAVSTLIVYPAVFHPIVSRRKSFAGVLIASIASSVTAFVVGALLVTLETTLSGVTALSFSRFSMFMIPIHIVIGAIEGVATAFVIWVVMRMRPEILYDGAVNPATVKKAHRRRLDSIGIVALVVIIAIIVIAIFTYFMTDSPDGLEWSIRKAMV